MDFNLKQWRYDESASEGHQQQESKIPRFVLDSSNNHHLQQQQNSVETALSLFAHEGGGPNTLYNSSCSDNKIPGMGSGGCFSTGQWQELELQASIYRHMIAGSTVPPELLQLVTSSHHPTSYFHLSSQPLQQFYPHANLVQSGYWGRAAMDPEPGRCRRTDGKKWRCSRDVVAGQKYCERHMNRGKNRSRKPVETNPTSTGGGDILNYSTVSQGMNFGSGGGTRFTLSGHSPSMDLLHLSQRPKTPFETTTQNDDQNPGGGGGRVLRRFFNDWPGSLNHTDNAAGSVTDFSLKLGTGYNNGDETSVRVVNGERDSRNHQLNWNYNNNNNNTWEANNSYNQVAHIGGPLAEALR